MNILIYSKLVVMIRCYLFLLLLSFDIVQFTIFRYKDRKIVVQLKRLLTKFLDNIYDHFDEIC